ncbi:helix-turn-helix transcriptional regulator [Prauserella endophytica]|uniref:Helix-turn-helix domain-containing protein n=1 Tax=Prauserella endophytica TaxID=1592324 RepID=A0ABY2RZ07_9PSEU|nr:helix-turn-helix domain-containing protein [Prauserella endophytica]TKG66185.1 helix-turn-helix domain-containing protein [Prauserella endophytica]
MRELKPRLATRAEVAEYLGVPPATLTQWAHRGKGPAYALCGRHARYDWRDVEAWLSARKRGGGKVAC